jgi:cell division protein FtsI/penicillin-binding protein 2
MNCFLSSVKPLTPSMGRQLGQPYAACRIALLALGVAISAGVARGADLPLQSYVQTLMRGHRGVALVANPATGEILALSDAEMAFERAFPPGSTAKIVTAATALEEKVISPSDRIFCQRVPPLLGEAFHCSHPRPVEAFTLATALANSCNYFFATLSRRLTPQALAHGFAIFGFGSPVAGPNSPSIAGQVRVGSDAAAKALAALGERTILVTPAQLLAAYSVIAMHGAAFGFWQGSSTRHPSPLRRVDLRPGTFDTIEAGLEECVRSGTGQGAAVEGLRVAGKTGTSRVLGGSGQTHAWFVGYAPVSAPEIAAVIFLERGTGARDAAPLAGKILRRYFALTRRAP